MAENVKQDTTLEVVGIGAISSGVAVISTSGEVLSGVALGVLGIAVLAIKYWARQ